MNFFVVMLGLIAVALPAAPFWEGAPHFNFVFGMAPRIVVASLSAFLVGSFLNAYVMSRMKVASGGRDSRFADILSGSLWRHYRMAGIAGDDVHSDSTEIPV